MKEWTDMAASEPLVQTDLATSELLEQTVDRRPHQNYWNRLLTDMATSELLVQTDQATSELLEQTADINGQIRTTGTDCWQTWPRQNYWNRLLTNMATSELLEQIVDKHGHVITTGTDLTNMATSELLEQTVDRHGHVITTGTDCWQIWPHQNSWYRQTWPHQNFWNRLLTDMAASEPLEQIADRHGQVRTTGKDCWQTWPGQNAWYRQTWPRQNYWNRLLTDLATSELLKQTADRHGQVRMPGTDCCKTSVGEDFLSLVLRSLLRRRRRGRTKESRDQTPFEYIGPIQPTYDLVQLLVCPSTNYTNWHTQTSSHTHTHTHTVWHTHIHQFITTIILKIIIKQDSPTICTQTIRSSFTKTLPPPLTNFSKVSKTGELVHYYCVNIHFLVL